MDRNVNQEGRVRVLGFTLLEVLVTLFILSLLLLALNAMQLTALRNTTSAYYFSVATEQLQSMAERLEATHGNPSSLQLLKWNEQNKTILPEGVGMIREMAPDTALILSWGKINANECDRTIVGQSGCLQLLTTIKEPS